MTTQGGGSAEDVSRLIDQVRATARASAPAAAEPVETTGEAGDGLVRVLMERGEVTEVQLDPRAMRIPSEILAEHLRDATNQALRRQREAVPDPAFAVADPEALRERLEELQATSVRQMQSFLDTIREAQSRVTRRRPPSS